MIGLGTLINVGAIIIGGLLGLFLGRSVKVRYQDILMIAVGICVLMLGIGGTMEQMLSITDGGLASGGSVLLFCVGANLVWGKKVKVANLLPAILFAVLWSFAPWA